MRAQKIVLNTVSLKYSFYKEKAHKTPSIPSQNCGDKNWSEGSKFVIIASLIGMACCQQLHVTYM